MPSDPKRNNILSEDYVGYVYIERLRDDQDLKSHGLSSLTLAWNLYTSGEPLVIWSSRWEGKRSGANQKYFYKYTAITWAQELGEVSWIPQETKHQWIYLLKRSIICGHSCSKFSEMITWDFTGIVSSQLLFTRKSSNYKKLKSVSWNIYSWWEPSDVICPTRKQVLSDHSGFSCQTYPSWPLMGCHKQIWCLGTYQETDARDRSQRKAPDLNSGP